MGDIEAVDVRPYCGHCFRPIDSPNQIYQSLLRVRDRNLATFVPFGPSSLQGAPAQKSPYVSTIYKVSDLIVANHTSITSVSHYI